MENSQSFPLYTLFLALLCIFFPQHTKKLYWKKRNFLYFNFSHSTVNYIGFRSNIFITFCDQQIHINSHKTIHWKILHQDEEVILIRFNPKNYTSLKSSRNIQYFLTYLARGDFHSTNSDSQMAKRETKCSIQFLAHIFKLFKSLWVLVCMFQ